MKFADLLAVAGAEPVFESSLLLAGDIDARDVRRQLSRWVRSGKLHQLRRGLYALAPPYTKGDPHPFLVANRLVTPSYVSLQSALAHHGLIPETVPVTTSVTTRRPGRWRTPLGSFDYRHVQVELLGGYEAVDLGCDQQGLVATPEKALLDLVYLEPGGESPEYLQELRLQGLDRVRLPALRALARATGRPKLLRAAEGIARLVEDEARDLHRLPA